MNNVTINLSSPRIESIDAIRGFALMGLFLVHMVEYFELYWYAPEPGWVHSLIFGLFAGKAYALFALMFGLSSYILLEAPFSSASLSRPRFAWRMLLLWLLGYCHSLIYAGDILQLLALGGLLILALHRMPTALLITLATIFLFQIPFFIQYLWILPNEAYTQPKFWAASGANFEVFANASLVDLLHYNMWQGQLPKWLANYETGALWNFLGLFFVGIVLARKNYFSKPTIKPYLITIVFLAALMITAVTLRNYYAGHFNPFMHRWAFEEGLTRLCNFCFVGIYLTLGVVLYRLNIGKILLKPLAACGRTSLSLYLLQTLVFVPLFYGFGLKLHATIGQSTALLLGIAAWIIEIIIANIWLSHYHYGPVENLWRKLTNIKLRQ